MKILIALLMLAGCASVPKQYEDERVVIIEKRVYVYSDGLSPAQVEAIAADYTVPVFDEAERKAWKRLLWGQGADAATTGIALSLGCVEANPLGPVGAMAAKVWLATWYRNEAAHTPKAFSVSSIGNTAGAVGAGAALWNITQMVGGCT